MDVAVIYSIGSDPALRQTLRVAASSGLERVDAPGGALAIVTDTRAGTVTALDLAHHAYTVHPAPPPVTPSSTRTGAAVVAGETCTEWAEATPDGRVVTSCVTEDGVMLRARAGDSILVEAVSVRRAPQDRALFGVPAHWSRVP